MVTYRKMRETETGIKGLMRNDEEKLIADAIVDAFAKAFGIKPGEISTGEYTETGLREMGWKFSPILHGEDRIGHFIESLKLKKILIQVDGSEGLAEVVANNLKVNEEIQALVNKGYVIDIDYDHRTYG